MIHRAFERNQILRFHSRGMVVSHLFYANDLLMFTNGNKKLINNLLAIVKNYKAMSGQMAILEKSSMFFSKHVTVARKRNLLASPAFKDGV